MSHRTQRGITSLLLLLLIPFLAQAADGCKLNRLLVVPITMDGLRPTVEAQINGSPALFTLDSGAFWSIISPASAQEYQLRLDYGRLPGLHIKGVGGKADAAITTVKTFTIFGFPIRNVDFVVGGSEVGQGTVGVIGQNVLRIADIEYDLARGTIALFKAENCWRADLAYWVKPGDPYSLMDIEETTPLQPHTTGRINLNGTKVRVVFDTGASTSIVSSRTAGFAGIKPDSPGVKPAGYATGFGSQPVQTWIATFPVLKIGDEEIHNAPLRFGNLGDVDMLLGADFFLSHRVYVATSQRKLYFTYNGGPVFLNGPGMKPKVAATAESVAKEGPQSDDAKSSPENAADLARRAAASAARRDFESALRDFNRASELAPGEASYYYQRAKVEFALRQSEIGSKDLDQAINIKPDYVDALVGRAEYRGSKHDTLAALADLDAIDRVVAKEADVRLALAELYSHFDRPAQAITQLNLWIAVHKQDPRVVNAYNERCWARALLGQELDEALSDCNSALSRNPHDSAFLDSRGLVNLRRGQFDKAIADYSKALKIDPKIAWSHYGRGIAELRKGRTAEGEADIAEAKSLDPDLAEYAQKIGVGP